MPILDDICAQIHGQSEGADEKFLNKLNNMVSHNEHYQGASGGFIIHHYAGQVLYDIEGFCDKNRDVLFPDIIQLMQTSDNPFLTRLFPDTVNMGAKSRPTTAGKKIISQGNTLVQSLMKCTPHYIRCIKPNETKKPLDWEETRVKHQVEYLGLRENIRVRRAGFAYRRPFEKFLWRYAILTKETWPRYRGDPRQGIHIIMRSVNMDSDQYQLGRTKVFVKNPESLFLLEEMRERKYDCFARVIQKAFRRYNARKHYARLKEQASDLLFNRKERRRYSLNRNFVGDYIGVEYQPAIQALIGRRERTEFAYGVTKYDRRWKTAKRDLVLTGKAIFLIAKELVKKGPEKGRAVEVVKRKIELNQIDKLVLSTLQDDFFVIFMKKEYASLLECPFKTEFLTTLSKRYKERVGGDLPLVFTDTIEYAVKKLKWDAIVDRQGVRTVRFIRGSGDKAVVKPTGKTLNISIGPGLPKDSRPGIRQGHLSPTPDILRQTGQTGRGHGYRVAPTEHPGKKTDSRGSLSRRLSSSEGPHPYLPATSPPTHPPSHLRPPAPGAPTASPVAGGQALPFMMTPAAGKAGLARQTIVEQAAPVPGGGRPKPKPRPPPKPNQPQARTLYAYDAQDTDELSFNAGDLIEILKEDESGWWTGRLRGKQGLFPSNYVQKC